MKKMTSGSVNNIKVENYNKHKRKNATLTCEPFYTYLNGYKTCLLLVPNGREEARNTH